jgi:hypothetical protein
VGLTTPHHKNKSVTKHKHEPRTWTDSLHVARREEKRNVYRLLVGKLEGKRPLVRPRRRWVDNIKMDLLEIVKL